MLVVERILEARKKLQNVENIRFGVAVNDSFLIGRLVDLEFHLPLDMILVASQAMAGFEIGFLYRLRSNHVYKRMELRSQAHH